MPWVPDTPLLLLLILLERLPLLAGISISEGESAVARVVVLALASEWAQCAGTRVLSWTGLIAPCSSCINAPTGTAAASLVVCNPFASAGSTTAGAAPQHTKALSMAVQAGNCRTAV